MKGKLARRNDQPGVSYRRQRESRQIDTRSTRLGERHGTPRETRVALLVADVHTVKEIAATLGVTEFSVGAHLRNIFSKVGIARQAALVRLVLTTTETERQD